MINYKFLFILILAGLTGLKSCKKDNNNDVIKETINIGLIVPMTSSPEYSQEIINASNLAIHEINLNGGVLGKELKLVVEDDNRDADISVVKANKLIDEDNVISLSLTNSTRSLAVFNEVMNTKDVIMISPSASSTAISSLADKNLVWRTIPSDAFQGKIAADYVKNTLNISEVAVMHINNSYGNGLAEEFVNHFTSLGGTIVTQQSYEEKSSYIDSDFKPTLDLIFENEPPFFYMVNNGLEASKIFTQISTENYFIDTYKPTIMTADGSKLESIITNSPAAIVEGMLGTSPTGTTNEEFDTNYRNFTGSELNVNETRNIYDAIYLLSYAMVSSNSTLPLEIAAKLIEVSIEGEKIGVNEYTKAKVLIETDMDIDYDGASGKIDFDENGDVTSGTYEIWKVENEEFVTVTTIDFP